MTATDHQFPPIHRNVTLAAPPEQVWAALTDHEAFGTWFHVCIDAPFVAGQLSTGHISYEGWEHLRWRAQIERIDAPHTFTFRWHPYAIDPEHDYSDEPPTLVEFRIGAAPGGTRVEVTESGFDGVPESRRADAYRANAHGWDIQMDNLRAFVERQ